MENSKALPETTLCGELKEKQWHQMRLCDSPQFIESLYIAKGLSTAVVKKAQQQIECILASRPTVKPLMKRRGLMSRAAKIPEKPVTSPPPVAVEESAGSVSQPSVPVLLESAQAETVTVYAVFPETPLFTQTTADNSQLGASKTTVSSTPNHSQLSKKESLPELAIKESFLSAMLATPVLTNDTLKTPLLAGSHRLTSLFENIADPVPSSTAAPCRKSPLRSPTAKKSTTPRTKIKVQKDKMEMLKSKYGIKCCQVTLYNYWKDYGRTKRYGEWDPSKLHLNNEVNKLDRKKDKKKKKLNDNQPKQSIQDSKHKYKRDASHNSDQPIPKKMRKVDDFETTVLSTAVPKVRIILRTDSDDPIAISMLEDSTKGGRNNSSSNKENIINDVERRDGSEADVQKHIQLPNLAVAAKKGIDSDELSKSDQALVVQVPQTGAWGRAAVKCSKKDEAANVNETEMDSNNPTKPPSLAEIDPAPVCNQSSAHDPAHSSTLALSQDISLPPLPVMDPVIPPSTPSPKNKVNDMPAITMETFQTRNNCLQSGQDISLPPLPVMDPVIPPSTPSPKNKVNDKPAITIETYQTRNNCLQSGQDISLPPLPVMDPVIPPSTPSPKNKVKDKQAITMETYQTRNNRLQSGPDISLPSLPVMDPVIPPSTPSPKNKVKDKPAITMETYQTRNNCLQSGQDISLPPLPVMDPVIPPSTPSPTNKVKDKPAITMETYQTRNNCLQSGQDISLPPLPVMDPVIPPSTPSPKNKVKDKQAITMETYQTRNNRLQSGPDISLPSLPVMDPVIPPSTPSPKNKDEPAITMEKPHDIGSSQEPNGYTSKGKPSEFKMSEKSPKTSKIDASPPVSKETHNNGADPRRKLFLFAVLENNNSTSCVSLERETALPVDNTATAELDLTSGKLHALLDRHRRTDYAELKVVQWENSACYRCYKAFPRHKDWSSHCKTCIL